MQLVTKIEVKKPIEPWGKIRKISKFSFAKFRNYQIHLQSEIEEKSFEDEIPEGLRNH